MAFAFFFPGQGSQSLHMVDTFSDIQVVRNTFTEASDILHQDLWAMLQAESDAEINATVNTQPLMLTTGIAIWRSWLSLNGTSPSVLAGHSLGEYSALVAGEALSFSDAIRLVRLRAEAMQSAVPDGQGGMAAIIGLDDEKVRTACAESAQGSIVEAVNFNSPGQVVIAGESAAVARACEACKALGAKRALPLPVSVPSHCALMKPAAEKLAETLATVTIVSPKIPVIHNADVQSHDDPAQIREALTKQLYSPVRWTETVQHIVGQQITLSAECGPGKVLTGLAKRIDSSMRCLALTDATALEAALNELQ